MAHSQPQLRVILLRLLEMQSIIASAVRAANCSALGALSGENIWVCLKMMLLHVMT